MLCTFWSYTSCYGASKAVSHCEAVTIAPALQLRALAACLFQVGFHYAKTWLHKIEMAIMAEVWGSSSRLHTAPNK